MEAKEQPLVHSDRSNSPRLSEKVTATQAMPISPVQVGTSSRSISPISIPCETGSGARSEKLHSSSSAISIPCETGSGARSEKLHSSSSAPPVMQSVRLSSVGCGKVDV